MDGIFGRLQELNSLAEFDDSMWGLSPPLAADMVVPECYNVKQVTGWDGALESIIDAAKADVILALLPIIRAPYCKRLLSVARTITREDMRLPSLAAASALSIGKEKSYIR